MTLKRNTPLSAFSKKRWDAVTKAGFRPTSTFTPKPVATGKTKAPRNTGPTRPVIALVIARSGHICEWPDCNETAVHRHHRLNRKAGSRFGQMLERINGAHWLLHACYLHHAYVTSPHGERLRIAKELGWLLLEGQDALRVPVLTRHDEERIWLLPDGTWLRYEEACA